MINLQLAEGYQEALLVFCTDVGEQMRTADTFLTVDCWSGEEFRRASEMESAEEIEAALSGQMCIRARPLTALQS